MPALPSYHPARYENLGFDDPDVLDSSGQMFDCGAAAQRSYLHPLDLAAACIK
jgi:hypothetical protein